jgi:hypothetical protein
MHPPVSPKPEWRALLDEMAVIATKEYRSIVFQEPRFVEYFRCVRIILLNTCDIAIYLSFVFSVVYEYY